MPTPPVGRDLDELVLDPLKMVSNDQLVRPFLALKAESPDHANWS